MECVAKVTIELLLDNRVGLTIGDAANLQNALENTVNNITMQSIKQQLCNNDMGELADHIDDLIYLKISPIKSEYPNI